MKHLGAEYDGRSHVVNFTRRTDFTLTDHFQKTIHSSQLPKADKKRLALHHSPAPSYKAYWLSAAVLGAAAAGAWLYLA